MMAKTPPARGEGSGHGTEEHDDAREVGDDVQIDPSVLGKLWRRKGSWRSWT